MILSRRVERLALGAARRWMIARWRSLLQRTERGVGKAVEVMMMTLSLSLCHDYTRHKRIETEGDMPCFGESAIDAVWNCGDGATMSTTGDSKAELNKYCHSNVTHLGTSTGGLYVGSAEMRDKTHRRPNNLN
jgi:crotonobetainyl-CoA:carnitine CoA-transferase CaiB-like acyl-CoA transferase